MIIIETSAVVAILNGEPPAAMLTDIIDASSENRMASVSFMEAGMVMALQRRNSAGVAVAELQRFVQRAAIDIVPVDAELARLALEARIRFGKGFGHPAALNFSDCFSYALAKKLGAPLLFVGDDFAHTDIAPALA